MKKVVLVVFVILNILVSGCRFGLIGNDNSKGAVLYTFTDVTGMKFDFYEKPKRIVSLNNSVDEILLDLVSFDRIAALTHLADDETLCCAFEKAKKIPGRVHGSNLEQIVALRPDVVIIGDWVGSDYINSLRQYGVKVIALHTPDTYKEIMQFIQEVADIVGEGDVGGKIVRDLQHRAEYFRNKAVCTYGEKNLRTVLVLSTMGVMGQKGTFNDICYLAGVKNGMGDIDVPQGMMVSDEKVIDIDPDVMILPSWDYSKSNDMSEFRKKVLNNPAYQNLKAVRNRKIPQINDKYLYSTSQYSIRAIEEIAHAAYPELY